MAFADVIAALTDDQRLALGDDFIERLTAEHTGELDIRDAAVRERDAQIEAFDAEREQFAARENTLKAANYDLLLKATPPKQDNDEDDDNAGDEPDDIDDLFGYEDK